MATGQLVQLEQALQKSNHLQLRMMLHLSQFCIEKNKKTNHK